MSDKNYSWAVRGYEKDAVPPLLVLIPEGDDAAGAEEAAREAAREFEQDGGTSIAVERVES